MAALWPDADESVTVVSWDDRIELDVPLHSRCRRRWRPVLGFTDPNPMPRIHLFRRSRRRAT